MSAIRRVAVIGAGQMGLGISQVVALGGYEVGLYDADPARPPQAIAAVAASLARNVGRGKSDTIRLVSNRDTRQTSHQM